VVGVCGDEPCVCEGFEVRDENEDGENGVDGVDGEDGIDGVYGVDGVDGVDGCAGVALLFEPNIEKIDFLSSWDCTDVSPGLVDVL